MSSDAKLPPYSAHSPSQEGVVLSPQNATHARIAGNVQTCSIKDLQLDYLKIVRESATSFYICLTVDPTPLYRVEFVEDSTKVGDIQIFSASDTALPAIAAARLSLEPKSRSKPVAMICTSKPYLPDSHWRPVTRASMLSYDEDYHSAPPIVTVPGTAPTYQQFAWRTNQCDPLFELWWDGPIVHTAPCNYIKDQRDPRHVFATMVRKSEKTDNLIEIRRGGGLEFELSVVLEMFAILHHKRQQLM
jgi:hypothetical protein